ncbi:hypothetical protein C7271_18100 [filamentous cyanobacterium CCP5]|nr:hypothetical protein C7271_18100 [filamentous cyanobacterium CCP5]
MASEDEILNNLRSQLQAESLKKQLSAVHELVSLGDVGIGVLTDTLEQRQNQPPTLLDGKIVQVLYATQQADLLEFVSSRWPQGRLPTPSAAGIDYSPLQELLAQQDFEAADRLTLEKLCELAGPGAVKRKWLYFTEVFQFPNQDLLTLDALWSLYSEGKFGFSRQRQIWQGLGQDWNKFWVRIAWKQDNVWTRYPNEFIWDLSAPDGHLPLSNQLRGVRVMDSLLNHPVWSADR